MDHGGTDHLPSILAEVLYKRAAFEKAAFEKAFYITIITFRQLYNHTIKMFPPFLPIQFYCDTCQTDVWTSGVSPAAQAA